MSSPHLCPTNQSASGGGGSCQVPPSVTPQFEPYLSPRELGRDNGPPRGDELHLCARAEAGEGRGVATCCIMCTVVERGCRQRMRVAVRGMPPGCARRIAAWRGGAAPREGSPLSPQLAPGPRSAIKARGARVVMQMGHRERAPHPALIAHLRDCHADCGQHSGQPGSETRPRRWRHGTKQIYPRLRRCARVLGPGSGASYLGASPEAALFPFVRGKARGSSVSLPIFRPSPLLPDVGSFKQSCPARPSSSWFGVQGSGPRRPGSPG